MVLSLQGLHWLYLPGVQARLCASGWGIGAWNEHVVWMHVGNVEAPCRHLVGNDSFLLRGLQDMTVSSWTSPFAVSGSLGPLYPRHKGLDNFEIWMCVVTAGMRIMHVRMRGRCLSAHVVAL